jgi:hypothetical protein
MVKTIDSERLKTELLGMQHWEDEGGQMIEGNNASPDLRFARTAPIHARRRHVASLQWDKAFVIQPFHRSASNFLIIQEPAVNTG